MIDYMVYNMLWNEHCTFQTIEEAKVWIESQLDIYPDQDKLHYIIYKRERIDA